MPRCPIGDVEIEFDDVGRGDAVLLLHGFPTSRRLWAGVAPALANAGMRAIVPDLVGYGDSPAPAGLRLDMASQARWLLGLLDALGLERVSLVAHDVGTAAAQLMVVAAPARFRRLALLDGGYEDEWAMEALQGIRDWDPAMAGRLVPVLSRRLDRSGALREVLAGYAGEEGGLRLIRAARDLDPRQTAGLAGALRAAHPPSLVLWGERDAFFPVETIARPLAALLGARLVTLPGGHFLPVDLPGDVAALLAGFLSPRDAGAGPGPTPA